MCCIVTIALMFLFGITVQPVLDRMRRLLGLPARRSAASHEWERPVISIEPSGVRDA